MQRSIAWTLRSAACFALAALPARTQEPAAHERPRLVVLVAVDQLGPEQIDRLAPWLEGGLGRFVREGRMYVRAELQHGITETAAGHASLGTGCHPARHGLIANEWWADDKGARTYCVRDAQARPVTSSGVREESAYAGWRVSPASLRVPGFAERLRAAAPQSRCVSIAGKDRSAIGMVGRGADAVVWWDQREGGFLSSTSYGAALPEWVRAWNQDWRRCFERGPLGKGWESSLPLDLERSATAAEEQAGEGTLNGRRAFPHALPAERVLEYLFCTPAPDLLALELASAAVDALALGADEHPDLLALGLSACDVVGHEFGPTSREVTDLLLRLDRALGVLFARLDERVGRERWIAVLSADHGVLELPEVLAARGIDARRVPTRSVSEALKAARAELAARFGADYVAAANHRGVRLDRAALSAAGVPAPEVRTALAEAIARHGAAWVERVWTYDQLQAVAAGGAASGDGAPLLMLEARSFDAERSADLVIDSRPWLLHARKTGTSHGSAHAYDRAVPLGFLGPGFERGRSYAPACNADVLPTVLARLGFAVPGDIDGKVLR